MKTFDRSAAVSAVTAALLFAAVATIAPFADELGEGELPLAAVDAR